MHRRVLPRSPIIWRAGQRESLHGTPRRQPIGHSRSLILVACALALSLGTALASTAATTPKSTAKKTLKPDYSYFRGKTITIVITAQGAGAGDMSYDGLVPYMEAHLGATVNVDYVSAVKTVGEDTVGQSAPNGLTIGFIAIPDYIYAIATSSGELSFSLLGSDIFGASALGPEALVSCHNPSVTSLTQLFGSSTPQTILQNSGVQGAGVFSDLVTDMYGYPHSYVRAYTSTATLLAGCQRGDGTLASTGSGQWLNASETAFTPGATPLLLSNGPFPSGSPQSGPYANTPTLAQFEAKHPPTTTFGKRAYKLLEPLLSNSTPYQTIFGPKGIPPAIALALQDTIHAAFNSAGMHEAFNLSGYRNTYFSPQQVYAWIKQTLKEVPNINGILAHP